MVSKHESDFKHVKKVDIVYSPMLSVNKKLWDQIHERSNKLEVENKKLKADAIIKDKKIQELQNKINEFIHNESDW